MLVVGWKTLDNPNVLAKQQSPPVEDAYYYSRNDPRAENKVPAGVFVEVLNHWRFSFSHKETNPS